MRNLAIRLVLWLSARFEIVLIDEQRKFIGGDAVERGKRWEMFATEQGGLFDMIDKQRREAFEAFADTRPDQIAEKEYLAMQDRALRQLRARVDSIIASGKIAAKQSEKQFHHIRKS
jgi:hypothetical protein